MKHTPVHRVVLFLVSVTALHAVQFPPPANTNTVNNGTGAPPMTAEESLANLTKIPPGFKGSVFAAEPDVQNPLQMTWDSRGRLWISENYSYESDKLVDTYNDRIVILEGADGHGKFTKRTVFADNIKRLMGFAVAHGGVWAIAPPNILFIPDRNADGVPDGPAEIVYDGFAYAGTNMHTTANSLVFGLDGWIYGRTGHAHLHMVGPPGTPMAQRVRLHGSLFRFHPRTHVFEALMSGAVNTFGQDWDKYGEHFTVSTTIGPFWYVMPGAKLRSSSGEPNQKAYELLEQTGDFNFGGPGGRGAAGAGARAGAGAARGGAVQEGIAGITLPGEPARGRGVPPAGAGNLPPWAAGPWNNGHSVGGAMFYQGDNWPAEYRDRFYSMNLFGHKIISQTVERSGSGYVIRRSPEPDIFEFTDPWFRGIDITYGPDGGVFVDDWTDTGDYHNLTGSNRLSGRIFKLTYGDAKPSSGSDLRNLSVEQLVALNTHANEWFPRAARMEFSNRMADGRGLGNARQLLLEQFARETDVPRKLRSLLTLYTINGTDESFLVPLLRSPEEHLRTWAIRLLTEHWPLDALHTNDQIPEGADAWRNPPVGVRFVQQRPARAVGGPEVAPAPAVIAEFARMAAQDPSSLVRLVLASTLQRMPFELRPAVAAGLVTHKEDATDKNLPLMVWWALIPLAEKSPAALVEIAVKSELRSTRKYITRRLAEDITTNPIGVNELIAAAAQHDEAYSADLVDGLTQGLQGQRGVPLPKAWEEFSLKAAASSNTALVAKVRSLDVALGSPRGLTEATKTALDAAAPVDTRKNALQALLNARAPDLRGVAEQLLEVKGVNAVAASALATFNDPTIGAKLVAAYPKFDVSDRPQLIAALAARPSFANLLLDSIASGKVARIDVSASAARQIRSLNDAALTKKLGEVWGEVRDTPDAKLKLLAAYKTELSTPVGGGPAGGGRAGGGARGAGRGGNAGNGMPGALLLADRSAGRALFTNTCATCHTLFGEGGKIGPDLTGGQKRRDLDMLLGKLVDPSSEIPQDSRLTMVKLKDGRMISGMVSNRTANTMTLTMANESSSVALSDVVSTEQSPFSLMPEGLLQGMDATQRRNLVAYLMGEEQAPPAAPATP